MRGGCISKHIFTICIKSWGHPHRSYYYTCSDFPNFLFSWKNKNRSFRDPPINTSCCDSFSSSMSRSEMFHSDRFENACSFFKAAHFADTFFLIPMLASLHHKKLFLFLVENVFYPNLYRLAFEIYFLLHFKSMDINILIVFSVKQLLKDTWQP